MEHRLNCDVGHMTDSLETALKYQQAGRLKAAADCCARVLERQADNSGALQLMAFIRFQSGAVEEAEVLVRRALSVAADDTKSLNLLGVILRDRGRLEAALKPLQTAVRLRPDYAEAWNNLGIARMDLQQLVAAEDAFRKALDLQPANAEIIANLGICLKECSDSEAAESLLRKAVDIAPVSSNLTSLAQVLKQRRQHAAAHDYLQQALALEPDNALTWLQYVLTARDDEPAATAIEHLTALLDKPPRSREDSACLHFALGNLYQRTGDFDRAFHHFTQGNLACRDCSYDPDRFARVVDETTGVCSAGWLVRNRSMGPVVPRPVFILGLPRTGKSLLEHLLAGHSALHALGESHAMPRALTRAATAMDTDLQGLLQRLTPAHAAAIRQRYHTLTEPRLPATAECTLDTLPANVRYLGVIACALPNARVIVCSRDPLDAGLAMYCKYFGEGHHYAQGMAHIGNYIRHHERFLAHWREVLPLPLLDVHYEDMVSRPQTTIARVLVFLGLAADPAVNRETEELHTRYIGLHHLYQAHLEPLQKALAG